jgi:hypothetical protein
MSIRAAQGGDEARLSLVGRATFLESYADLLPAEDILAHTEQQHAPGVYAAWLADPRYRCWLAEAGPGRAPVGYLVLSPPDLALADLTAKDLRSSGSTCCIDSSAPGRRARVDGAGTPYARAGFRRLRWACHRARGGAGLLCPDRLPARW